MVGDAGKPCRNLAGRARKTVRRRVWLPKPAQALLAELDRDDKGFVLAGQRGGAVDRLDQLMRAICADLGVDDKVRPTTYGAPMGRNDGR